MISRVRYINIIFAVLLMGFSSQAIAQDDFLLQELNLTAELSPLDVQFTANGGDAGMSRIAVPNIPDSAFKKPFITMNNIHEYLGLASLAFGGLAAISVPENGSADLVNTFHYRFAKYSWQLGAAAVGTGFYAHWDDFHLEDGLLDPDNLHIMLGFLGTLGYYLAVAGAVDEYNTNGYVDTENKNHATYGILGGAAMSVAIGFTW
ncbi:MAG: hypothetical protein R8M45_09970 [Ghiorsea sp.]